MASRVKEDEKNERIIRGLLKLPENRRCINCNSLVCLFLNLIRCKMRIFYDCIGVSQNTIMGLDGMQIVSEV